MSVIVECSIDSCRFNSNSGRCRNPKAISDYAKKSSKVNISVAGCVCAVCNGECGTIPNIEN